MKKKNVVTKTQVLLFVPTFSYKLPDTYSYKIATAISVFLRVGGVYVRRVTVAGKSDTISPPTASPATLHAMSGH
jgi:hypothetical protein